MACEDAFEKYRKLLEFGDTARAGALGATGGDLQPYVRNGRFLNLLKFMTQRCDPHAQFEIRVYADAMRELVRPIAPVCVGAWEGASAHQAILK